MTNKHAKALGKLGGDATKTTQPKGFYKRISKLGVEARRKNKERIKTT